jgi:hypothetical protein
MKSHAFTPVKTLAAVFSPDAEGDKKRKGLKNKSPTAAATISKNRLAMPFYPLSEAFRRAAPTFCVLCGRGWVFTPPLISV